MNRKLIIIILLDLALLVGFTFVYARHINKEARPTKPHPRAGIQPVETVPILKRRVRSGTIQEKPKTLEDLKATLERVGKTYTLPEAPAKTESIDVEVTKIMTPAGILDERSLTECRIWPMRPIGYPPPWYFDQYLNCCGKLEIWVYEDAQYDPDASGCGYPIYPFEVSDVEFAIYTPGACTLECEFAVTWDYGSIYWGYPFPYYEIPDWSSGTVSIELPGGVHWVHVDIPAEERPCYHVPFFARFSLLNSDDFTEGPDPERCGPDTTRYDFWIQGVFDYSQREHYGYYYNDLIGGYYDLKDVRGGIYALLASGFTRDQNECELESLWYHKPAYFDTTEEGEITAYAPDGMPDFPQIEPYYSGPAALANCLWWCFAGGFPWYAISNWYGGWDPAFATIMIGELAECVNTGASGTNVYDLQQCINDLKDTPLFSLTESTIFQPTFDQIEYQVRLSQDVILLLGFWYFDEELQEWLRIGGHYVTMSGVNWEFFLFSFSDPAINGVCDFSHPGDSSGGVYIPHAHPCDPPCHYDAGNVSHDYYQILLDSPSPGGVLAIPDYYVDFADFFEQNVPPEFANMQAPTGTPQYPVVTEIEFAVVICPAWPFMSEWLDSWNVGMVKTNYGGEGPGYLTWVDGGTDQLWEGTIILGTNGDDLAMGLTAVDQDIRFFPYFGLECEEHFLWGTGPGDSIYLDTCYAKYYHNVPDYGLSLDVEMFAIGFDPWGDSPNNCIGRPCEDMILQKFIIINTGDTTINDLEWALFMDWNVNLYHPNPDANTSFGGGDSLLNTGWAYDSTEEGIVILTTLVPSSPGKTAPTWNIGDQNTYLYPHIPGGPYDELKAIMETNIWSIPDKVPANTDTVDYAYLMSSEEFSLDPGERILQEYIIWYDNHIPETDLAAFRHKLYQLLRLAGYYRGDVGNFSTGQGSPGIPDITDIVYIANFLFKDGDPPRPFVDQGDVNCDGECSIADVVYLANYLFRDGGPPVDKNRFLSDPYDTLFDRQSLFADPQWQNLGQ